MIPKLLRILFHIGRALLALAVIGGEFYWWETRPLPGPLGEVVGPDEDIRIAEAINASMVLATQDHDIRWQQVRDNSFRRDVHGKTPGCVKAAFTVLDNLASPYRFGLFAKPGEYKGWLRFSNGNHQFKPDYAGDVRGVALKVTGVPGEKLLESERDALTQDFVLMNSPVYFFRDVSVYAHFSTMLGWGPNLFKYGEAGVLLRDTLPLLNYRWNPLAWNWRSLIGAAVAQRPPPPSPLHQRYWSASAYTLGPQQYVKYSVIPRPCPPDTALPAPPPIPDNDDNFLRTNLKRTLAARPWCFDFAVQLQVPGKNMPVEDPTIPWEEKDSPFVTVAQIQIPRDPSGEFDTPPYACFCEALAMNPWHALPDHRPVGVFNRIRKNVYQEGARFRRTKMDATQAEPTGWELSLTTRDCAGPAPAPKTAGLR